MRAIRRETCERESARMAETSPYYQANGWSAYYLQEHPPQVLPWKDLVYMNSARTVRVEGINDFQHLNSIFVYFTQNYGVITGLAFNQGGIIYVEYQKEASARRCQKTQLLPATTLWDTDTDHASEITSAINPQEVLPGETALSEMEVETLYAFGNLRLGES